LEVLGVDKCITPKQILKVILCEDVDWNLLGQDRDQWQNE